MEHRDSESLLFAAYAALVVILAFMVIGWHSASAPTPGHLFSGLSAWQVAGQPLDPPLLP